MAADRIEVLPVRGLPEVRPGHDLATLLGKALVAEDGPGLSDGDVLVVTQKIVSKAEGRLVHVGADPSGREQARQRAIEDEGVRVVARRGATVIAETPMELVVLGQREFAGLIDEVPGFARKLLSGMAKRLREADARSVQ